MVDWWSEIEHAIVECLNRDGAMSPRELGRQVGISEGEATLFLCMLAREGKVRICAVECMSAPGGARDARELDPLEVGAGWD